MKAIKVKQYKERNWLSTDCPFWDYGDTFCHISDVALTCLDFKTGVLTKDCPLRSETLFKIELDKTIKKGGE